tara:strand:+ start:1119 stop:1700 length:582 start_codon:yes stop_codon:yes gene_type:complete
MSSILKVDQLQDSGGNSIITSDGAGNLTAGTIPAKTIGTGAVLQLQSGVTTSVVSSTSESWVDTGFSVSITPTSTSSKILILCHIASGASLSNNNAAFQIRRNTTQILGNSNGNVFPGTWTGSDDYTSTQFANKFVQGVDTPNTNAAISYKLYWASNTSGNTIYLNRPGSGTGTNTAEFGVGATNMVLMEIAG